MLTTERKVSACPHNQALTAMLLLHREVLGSADLGMEAIYEFDVVDMPVTVVNLLVAALGLGSGGWN